MDTYWILKLNELWFERDHKSRNSSLSSVTWVDSIGEIVGFEKKSRSCLAVPLGSDVA